MHENDPNNIDPDSVAALFENADREVQKIMLPVVFDPPEETTADQVRLYHSVLFSSIVPIELYAYAIGCSNSFFFRS